MSQPLREWHAGLCVLLRMQGAAAADARAPHSQPAGDGEAAAASSGGTAAAAAAPAVGHVACRPASASSTSAAAALKATAGAQVIWRWVLRESRHVESCRIVRRTCFRSGDLLSSDVFGEKARFSSLSESYSCADGLHLGHDVVLGLSIKSS